MELEDLEKRAKTIRKARIFQTISKIQTKCRQLLGVPSPHDRFTPYNLLSPEEKRERIARIKREHRLRA
ncbi:MAG: hypothetical protein QW212_00810 [Nitrososphaerales archaeon]